MVLQSRLVIRTSSLSTASPLSPASCMYQDSREDTEAHEGKISKGGGAVSIFTCGAAEQVLQSSHFLLLSSILMNEF